MSNAPSKNTMIYECGNCGYYWEADKYPESCHKCESWYVMTTDEWSEQDALDEAMEAAHAA